LNGFAVHSLSAAALGPQTRLCGLCADMRLWSCELRVALLTPTYVKDVERFELLCESIDRMATGYERHYVIVNPDSDAPLFERFASKRRIIVPGSKLLPKWLWSAPKWLSRSGRRVWVSPFSLPVHGWHVQQILKIAGVLAAEEDRVCIVDSDNLFFRPFDVRLYAAGEKTPLYVDRGSIEIDKPRHSVWARNGTRLLGLPKPAFPADDYIGNEIIWDKSTAKAMTERIRAVNGVSWELALCRTRQFSEYLLYGMFVANNPEFAARHETVETSLAYAHWEESQLDANWIATMIDEAAPGQVALAIQSYSGTAILDIRSAIRRAEAV
jgi:Family of unknown function (DUF6492)